MSQPTNPINPTPPQWPDPNPAPGPVQPTEPPQPAVKTPADEPEVVPKHESKWQEFKHELGEAIGQGAENEDSQ
jgi:hypothetical protein